MQDFLSSTVFLTAPHDQPVILGLQTLNPKPLSPKPQQGSLSELLRVALTTVDARNPALAIKRNIPNTGFLSSTVFLSAPHDQPAIIGPQTLNPKPLNPNPKPLNPEPQ